MITAIVAVLAISLAQAQAVPQSSAQSSKQDPAYGRLESKVDSLENSLRDHRVVEGFFESMLDEQSSRFGLLMTGILGLVAVVSYSGFRHEVSRLKNEYAEALSDYEKKHTAFVDDFARAEATLIGVRGNTNRLIARTFDSLPAGAFIYMLGAASSHNENWRRKKESAKPEVADKNLQDAIELLDAVPMTIVELQLLKEHHEFIEESLVVLGRDERAETKYSCAKIRVRLKDLLDALAELEDQPELSLAAE